VCWVLGRCLIGAGDVGSQGVEVGERGVGMRVSWSGTGCIGDITEDLVRWVLRCQSLCRRELDECRVTWRSEDVSRTLDAETW
jgi:hypothetical protein